MLHNRLLLAGVVMLAGCGGSVSTDLSESTTSTTTAKATVSSTTPTASPTTTESNDAEPASTPAEDRLASGLLSLADLPAGYVADFENGMFINEQTSMIGDHMIAVCDGEVDELPASDARLSMFNYPTATLGFPPDGVIEEIAASVRIVEDGDSDLVEQVVAGIAPCVGSTLSHPAGTAAVSAIEVPEAGGVTGTGFQLVFSDGDMVGRSFLIYVLQTGRLDAYLFMSGAAPELDQLPTLAEPIVAAAQQRLADCADDTQVCSA